MRRDRWLQLMLLGSAGFLATTGAMAWGWLTPPKITVDWQPPGAGYVPAGLVLPGRELALVFIGSPTCVWSNQDFLPEALEKAKLGLAEQARSSGHSFTAVAAVKSTDFGAGIEFVRRFGQFDEVSVGRGWYNVAILRYVFEKFAANAATPQILVVEREVTGWPSRGYVGERVLLRKTGSGPIVDWVEAGLPLPRSADPPSVTSSSETSTGADVTSRRAPD